MATQEPSKIDIFMHCYFHGKRFGFPECCIRYFLSGGVLPDERPDKPLKLIGSGYIPCPTCNKNYSATQLVREINKNRTHPAFFPLQGNDITEPFSERFHFIQIQKYFDKMQKRGIDPCKKYRQK